MLFKTIVLFLLSSSLGFTQVATPQADPIFPATAAASLSWTKSSSISVAGIIQDGDKTTTSEANIGLKTKGVLGNFNLRFGNLALQLNGFSSAQKHDEITFDTKVTDNNFLSSLKMTEALSVGVVIGRRKVDAEEPKLNSWQDSTDATFSSTNTKVGGSVSFKFIPQFTLGIGINLISNDHSKRVKNKWLERNVGISFSSGGDFPLARIEVDWHHSPRRKQVASDSLMINHHRKTDRYEFILDGKLLNFSYSLYFQQQLEEAATTNTSNIETKISRVGLGYGIFANKIQSSIYFSKIDIKDDYFTKEMNEFMLAITLQF